MFFKVFTVHIVSMWVAQQSMEPKMTSAMRYYW